MPLNKDWREFVELLHSNAVEGLVVGGGLPTRRTQRVPLPTCPTDYHRYSAILTVSESGRLREDAPTQNL